MLRRSFLAGAAVIGASSAFAAHADDAVLSRLEQIRAEAGIPALGGALVTPEGLSWQGVSGVRRAGGEDRVSASDLWHLGSNTKAMTAALYARLVEQGRAAWGATLPELFDDLEVDPAWAAITIEQLFGHRAGVLDPAVMTVWMMTAWGDGDVSGLRTNLARTVLAGPPAGQPGAFAYSNAGYILAGAAIERLTGEPWEDTMRHEVFAPLGMTSAGFGAPRGDNAWGHQGTELRPMDPAQPGADNPPALGPAGTVHASLASYAAFLRVFLGGGGGWLSEASLAHLTTPLGGPGQEYALGWSVASQRPWAGSRPVWGHDGSNTLWLARAIIAPGRGVALICVANAADPAQSAVDALTPTLIERFPA